jgi:hypothetical protein
MGSLGIPTIGFSPCEECQAHVVDEHVRIDYMVSATKIYTAINDPAASSRVSRTTSKASFEGESLRALPVEGATLAPTNCDRSEAEQKIPCSKLQGINKLKWQANRTIWKASVAVFSRASLPAFCLFRPVKDFRFSFSAVLTPQPLPGG